VRVPDDRCSRRAPAPALRDAQPRRRRQARVDDAAATLLLRTFLERQGRSGAE
jgi:hypothetical protein